MNIKLKTLLKEDVFGNIKDLDMEKITSKINAPYVKVVISKIGGKGRESLIFTISLDNKTLWPNEILHNSRYLQFIANNDNEYLELLSKSNKISVKFRKVKVKDVTDIISKINKYINSIK